MRVFVTGATGFVGSAVVRELRRAGHGVLGLSRSAAGAAALEAAGAEALRGDLEDLASLRQGAAAADGVIHLAFGHDFTRFAESCAIDERAIAVLGGALEGSGRTLVVTSGVGLLAHGRPATEQDRPQGMFPRASERAASAFIGKGVNVAIVRLAQVHDTARQGFVSRLVGLYREKGECAVIGNGANRWSAVPVGDAAVLYRLALERGAPEAVYHAVAEEGVALRDIADTVAARLGLPTRAIEPDQAEAYFGMLAMFAALDMSADSTATRLALGWQPAGRGLLDDLRELQI